MSVAYEPRNFINEGAYPAMGDDADVSVDQRFTDNDVAEQLSQYTAEASMLPDDRDLLGDDRSLMADHTLQDPTQLDLSAHNFPSPIHASLHTQLPDPIPESKDPSPGVDSPTGKKGIPKPDREVHKGPDGKYHCPLDDCKEDIRSFSRKCEWNKHMDKHERPYRCLVEGCENLPGFTYSGGLLRHEREVHGKHGGPKNMINCPHQNCKRHTGKGFSRQENLNEHLRRVHTTEGSPSPLSVPLDNVLSPDDISDKSAHKRKRMSSNGIDGREMDEELGELRGEIKRLKSENEKLRVEMEQQTQHSLAMMAQIAELQEALQHGLAQHRLGAPTAQMI